MAQPTVSDVHIDVPLTNISTAYMQDQSDYVAWQAFPVIPVDKESDRYFTYGKDFWMRNVARFRAPGTESAGAGYKIANDGYFCNIKALHHDISDPERANADTPLDMDADATLFTSRALVLEQEIAWASSFFGTGIWTGDADFTPAILWSDDASTPINDIITERDKILKVTGYRPNTLVIPQTVMTRFENHPDFIDRVKYTSDGPVTKDIIARLLGVSRILVAAGVYNSAAEGAAFSGNFIMDNAALLCYSPPNPGLRTPAAGYTFMWRGVSKGLGLNVGTKKFRMEHLESDRIESEISYAYKIVGSDLGVYFTGVLA